MLVESIKKLLDKQDLTADETRSAIEQIMKDEVAPAQTAAFLTALRIKGETADEIFGAASAMRDKVRRVRHRQKRLFDSCGTGGDGSGTFNISTTAAFVIAGCGVAVAKHGNRSVTSRCGSADVLEALGARLDLTPDQVGMCIDEIGIGFLFAPHLHPAMKNVAPVRKSLGFRTVFNILGPLTNPAFTTHQLIGVFDPDITETLAAVAKRLGIKNVAVVHSMHRVDELTTACSNKISVANNGSASSFQLHPREFGFQTCELDDLRGGSIRINAAILEAVLKGEQGPRRDTVVLNAGLSLMVAGETSRIEDGVEMAAECIDSGDALKKLHEFIAMTGSLSHAA